MLHQSLRAWAHSAKWSSLSRVGVEAETHQCSSGGFPPSIVMAIGRRAHCIEKGARGVRARGLARALCGERA